MGQTVSPVVNQDNRVLTSHPDGLREQGAASLLPITPGSDLVNGITRAIVCGTAGTLNGVDENGNTVVNFPLQQGYNPIRMASVAVGGTAANLWALN